VGAELFAGGAFGIEAIEDMFEVGVGDAGALVFHGEFDHVAGFAG